MATKLYLYKDCKITRDRNAKVDDIETYLTTCVATGWASGKDIQYQQIALNKKLKLDLDQLNVGKQNYNYAKVYQDEKAFYFFIDKANWKSTSTVEFDLTLDTVNTFASDFTFNKKTRILRQHKDRIAPTYFIEEGWDQASGLLEQDLYVDPVGLWEVWDYDEYSITNPDYQTPLAPIGVPNAKIVVAQYDGFENIQTWGQSVSESIHRIGREEIDGSYFFYIDTYDPISQEETHVSIPWETIATDFAANKYYVIKQVLYPERLQYTTDWEQMFGGTYHRQYKRLIDQEPENINPPQFKIEEENIQDYNSATKWYCCWASTAADEGSPVRTYLIPEDPISVKIKTDGSLTYTDLTENKYYYLMPKYLSSFKYDIGDTMGTRIFSAGSPYDTYLYDSNNEIVGKITNQPAPPAGKDSQNTDDSTTYFVKMYRDGTNIKLITYKFWRDIWGWKETHKVSEKTVATVRFVNQDNPGSTYALYYYQSNTDYSSGNDIYNNRATMTSGIMYSSGYNSTTLNALSDLDRTDKKLLKLIAVPYSFFKVNDGEFVESPDWQISTTLKTVNNNDFYCLCWESNNKQSFSTTIKSPYNPMKALFTESFVEPGRYGNARIPDYESKLYHSEFYTPKFVYDSFNYQYNLENVDNSDWSILPENNIDYKFTNTCNSRFLFKFNLPLKRSNADYDQVCIVNRNNELMLYNSSYLDYIRTGYNYDIKNKEANLGKNIATTAVSTIGTAASIGITAALAAGSGSSAGPIGAAIGAAVGLTTGLINLAVSQSQADRAIQQKLDEANRQGVSVSACDDVDLLTDYTQGNIAKYTVYKCSDRVANTLNDLFYYCGYKDDIQAVPNLNTRKDFNYIECEAVFNEASNSVYKEYLDDIKERYRNGITVYHNIGGAWSWNQTDENWEISVIEALQ